MNLYSWQPLKTELGGAVVEFDGWGEMRGGDIHFRRLAQPKPFPAPDPPGTLDVRLVRASDMVAALDRMGVTDHWQVAQLLRDAVRRGRGTETVESLITSQRLESCNSNFRNLVIGRLAEDLFSKSCLEPLAKAGYEIRDYRGVYENRDFGIFKDGLELPINVKVAGTRFAQAKEQVGLEPEDCVPISCYKAVAAADPRIGKVPDLVFVHLVEHGLRGRVDGYMTTLTGAEQTVWQLLTWYGGRGMKQAQDQYVDTLFASRGEEILNLSDGAANLRVISARRVLSVMDQNRGRVTQIGVKSGQFGGDPTVHVSRAEETIPWQALATLLRTQGLREVLRGIRRNQSRRSADPSL